MHTRSTIILLMIRRGAPFGMPHRPQWHDLMMHVHYYGVLPQLGVVGVSCYCVLRGLTSCWWNWHWRPGKRLKGTVWTAISSSAPARVSPTQTALLHSGRRASPKMGVAMEIIIVTLCDGESSLTKSPSIPGRALGNFCMLWRCLWGECVCEL